MGVASDNRYKLLSAWWHFLVQINKTPWQVFFRQLLTLNYLRHRQISWQLNDRSVIEFEAFQVKNFAQLEQFSTFMFTSKRKIGHGQLFQQ